MKYYVCGFLFHPNRHLVALIRKARPKWQAGKLNGIGGHIEAGESPRDAMIREFREETEVTIMDWIPFFSLINPTTPEWTVYFYKSFQPGILSSPTDEEVQWCSASRYQDDMVPNLRWLIPLALEDVSGNGVQLSWPHPE